MFSVNGTIQDAMDTMKDRIRTIENGEKIMTVEEQVVGISGKVYTVRTEREKLNGVWEDFDAWSDRHAAAVAYWATK